MLHVYSSKSFRSCKCLRKRLNKYVCSFFSPNYFVRRFSVSPDYMFLQCPRNPRETTWIVCALSTSSPYDWIPDIELLPMLDFPDQLATLSLKHLTHVGLAPSPRHVAGGIGHLACICASPIFSTTFSVFTVIIFAKHPHSCFGILWSRKVMYHGSRYKTEHTKCNNHTHSETPDSNFIHHDFKVFLDTRSSCKTSSLESKYRSGSS